MSFISLWPNSAAVPRDYFQWMIITQDFLLHLWNIVLQAPVVQTLDSAIQWIKSILWITQLVLLILIHWIEIYLVDSAIQVLNAFEQPGHVLLSESCDRRSKLA